MRADSLYTGVRSNPFRCLSGTRDLICVFIDHCLMRLNHAEMIHFCPVWFVCNLDLNCCYLCMIWWAFIFMFRACQAWFVSFKGLVKVQVSAVYQWMLLCCEAETKSNSASHERERVSGDVDAGPAVCSWFPVSRHTRWRPIVSRCCHHCIQAARMWYVMYIAVVSSVYL